MYMVNIKCIGHHPEGTFVYCGVQKINVFTFCQFSIPFDGACSLHMYRIPSSDSFSWFQVYASK